MSLSHVNELLLSRLLCFPCCCLFFQLSSPVRSFDCILVARETEDQDDPSFRKREVYISEIKSKNLNVTVSSQLQSNRG